MKLKTALKTTGLAGALLLTGFATAAITDSAAAITDSAVQPATETPLQLAYFHIKTGERQAPTASSNDSSNTCIRVHQFEKRISVYQNRYCEVSFSNSLSTTGYASVHHTF